MYSAYQMEVPSLNEGCIPHQGWGSGEMNTVLGTKHMIVQTNNVKKPTKCGDDGQSFYRWKEGLDKTYLPKGTKETITWKDVKI